MNVELETAKPLSRGSFSFKFHPKSYATNSTITIGTLIVFNHSINPYGSATHFNVMFRRQFNLNQFQLIVLPKTQQVKSRAVSLINNPNVYAGLFDVYTVFDMIDLNREQQGNEECRVLSSDQIDYLWMVSDIYPIEANEKVINCPLNIFEQKVKELFNICFYGRCFHKGNLFVDKSNYKDYTQDYIRDDYFDQLVEKFNKEFNSNGRI
jgi:hypothetical protein